MGSSDQPSPEDVALGEPREDTPIPPALQVIHPPDLAGSHPGMPKLARTSRKRSLLPCTLDTAEFLTAEFLSPLSQPVSYDRGSGSARAGRHQTYYPLLEAL